MAISRQFITTYLGTLGEISLLNSSCLQKYNTINKESKLLLYFNSLNGGVKATNILNMTLKILKVATDRNVACFSADLTVNQILVEWNKMLLSFSQPVEVYSILYRIMKQCSINKYHVKE